MPTTSSEGLSVQEVERTLRQRGVEYVLAQYVDIYGVSKAKLVPVSHFEDLCTTGACFAGFAAGEGGFGVGPEFPDLHAIPDLRTLTILPWRKNVARFACNVVTDDGKPSPFCTRTILRRVVERVGERGFIPRFGMEPEFFLVKQTERGIEIADSRDVLAKPCYDLRGLTRSMDFLTLVMQHLNELGWDVEAADHEDANSQYEINIKFDEALNTADKYTFLKYMLSILANQLGLMACFMPKPFPNRTGNGAHVHMSLWSAKTGENAFLDPNDESGMGLSKTAYHFIGGLLKHARAYIAFSAPTVNSYKRLIHGTTASGATWAPVYVTYGGNNRTQMLRIPGPGRVEDRTVDSSCNPYLALAAILAAGMDGVENRIDPGPRNDENMYLLREEDLGKAGIRLLPSTLKEAVLELEGDSVIREAVGREFCEFYVKLKLAEWTEYHNTVSGWEIEKYLPLLS